MFQGTSPHETRPETATAVRRVHIDFLKMCAIGLDHLDLGKPHRHVISKDDPEVAITLSLLQRIPAGRFFQNGFRHVSDEEPGSSEFDRSQDLQILRARRGDRVLRRHSHGPVSSCNASSC